MNSRSSLAAAEGVRDDRGRSLEATWRNAAVRAWAGRHRLRVAGVRTESPGVVTILVEGEHLEELHAEAEQLFRWRFLTPDYWLNAYPFSLSAPPSSISKIEQICDYVVMIRAGRLVHQGGVDVLRAKLEAYLRLTNDAAEYRAVAPEVTP